MQVVKQRYRAGKGGDAGHEGDGKAAAVALGGGVVDASAAAPRSAGRAVAVTPSRRAVGRTASSAASMGAGRSMVAVEDVERKKTGQYRKNLEGKVEVDNDKESMRGEGGSMGKGMNKKRKSDTKK